jgi:hypothetical protein
MRGDYILRSSKTHPKLIRYPLVASRQAIKVAPANGRGAVHIAMSETLKR